jgi:AraC-like DNA-binding protein
LPFVRILEQRGISVPAAFNELLAADPDARIPISLVEQHLEEGIRRAGDPNLGIQAGRSMSVGDCPAIDYAMSTANTVREAVEIALQHARLCNDSLAIELQIDNARALVRLESSASPNRVSADFLIVGLYTAHVKLWPHAPGELECWFAHAQPADLSAYTEAIPNAVLRFNAPCYGFSFSAETLDRHLPSADPKLHAIVHKYADLMLAELPSTQTLAGDIRRMLPAELLRSRADAASVARKLHVSVRTLGRRLEEEGTSFKVLLNDVRRELALSMLVRGDLPIADVARQLDFADVSTFHRAFRRWTGQTPASYRANHATQQLGALTTSQQAS